ncbi:hypothetical protein HAU32_10100 [Weissella confusa]|uniref:HTH cro/C1-type domain-containing protein n=1 Tax=Weissella fermenti TaxID=2987699 RepID=A0ABT6D2U0_9LACO|nr:MULTISPECIES: hypothetical protein [Weissella]MBJ7689313.1 hypothetical protein [Weissella confusa]MCW0926365.1 hypothetical protein [Weissella sp. LMG 11983]MDF9298785.1 hypothetical protein [Weissella sp. BK2]
MKNNLKLSKSGLNNAVKSVDYQPRPETLKELAAAMGMTTDELIRQAEWFDENR